MSLFSFSHPPINLLFNFDEELLHFYRNVLLKMQLAEIEKLSTKKAKKKKLAKILHNGLSLVNAEYILRYSPCYSSAVASHFLRMVNKNPLIFRDALWKRCVNICCLGGGPVSEVVAISKLLSSAQEWFWFATRKPLHLHVTIVDKEQTWEHTAEKVLQTLKETCCMFDACKMVISFRFILADLSKPFNDDVKSALKEADIVTMVKFISVIRVQIKSTGISWLVQDIVTNMKNDAVLFYLDAGINKQWKWLHNSLGSFKDVKRIYGPIEIEPFTPELNSICRCIDLYWVESQKNIYATSCLINSCAWIKSDSKPINEIDGNADPLNFPQMLSGNAKRQKLEEIKRQWEVKVLLNQQVLVTFHQKVYGILLHKIRKSRKSNKNRETEPKDCFFLDYPVYKDKVLFPSKSKNRRIPLRETAKDVLV